MGVMYFLVCVRKHECNLPANIRTTVHKKTQGLGYVEKCDLLSETTLLPYFYDSVCVLYKWHRCLSTFSSQQSVSMIFVKQCW